VKLLNVSAWGHVVIVLFFTGLLVIAAGFTLTTTQLLFEYGFVGVRQLHYGWDTLLQLNSAVRGEYTGMHLVAVILSWMLLACYLIANSVKKWVKSGIAHEGLEMFCHAMIILDGIANWVTLSAVPWYWQIMFTIAIYTALSHFGKLIMGHATLAIMEFFDL
jgi:hypothetical protein